MTRPDKTEACRRCDGRSFTCPHCHYQIEPGPSDDELAGMIHSALTEPRVTLQRDEIGPYLRGLASEAMTRPDPDQTIADLRAELAALRAERDRLAAERDAFHSSYRSSVDDLVRADMDRLAAALVEACDIASDHIRHCDADDDRIATLRDIAGGSDGERVDRHRTERERIAAALIEACDLARDGWQLQERIDESDALARIATLRAVAERGGEG